jgi:ABC-type nitrate/sulfonate/bicarbonate transport system permease component
MTNLVIFTTSTDDTATVIRMDDDTTQDTDGSGRLSRAPSSARRAAAAAIPPLLVLAALVCAWELTVAWLDIRPRVLPAPSLVVQSGIDDMDRIRSALWVTTRQAVLGIVLAAAVGVLLAIALDWSSAFRRSVYPLLVASQTLPIIALAPIVVIWFGFGPGPKVALVALFTFFSITVGTVQGLASSDPDAMALLRTMGATRRQLLVRVRIHSALPQFFTGLKVAVTYAYVAAIVAEFVGARNGIGIYMTAAKNGFRTDLVFAAVLVVSLATLALFGLVAIAERLAMPWRPPTPSAGRW